MFALGYLFFSEYVPVAILNFSCHVFTLIKNSVILIGRWKFCDRKKTGDDICLLTTLTINCHLTKR